MKKLALTIAIVLGLGMTTFAENGGGLFQRGTAEPSEGTFGDRTSSGIMLPTEHGQTGNADAPLGSGVVALLGLGAAYAMAKRNKKD